MRARMKRCLRPAVVVTVLSMGVATVACTDEPSLVPTESPTTAPASAPASAPATEPAAPDGVATTAGDPAPTDDDTDAVRRPEGFGTVGVTVTTAEGEVCELCLWSADTDDLRRLGLMFVDDLGDADGMAFVYDRPRRTNFTMRNTVLPLTIVFYGPDGRYMDAFDMEPCLDEPCPSYPTPDGFTVAIEVEQGRADELGLVPGSVLAVDRVAGGDGCAPRPRR